MEPQLQALADDLFHVRLPSGNAHLLNCYLWRSTEGITLVDTGWPGSAPHIETALHQIDAGRGDVSRVILTHFHADHVGSAAKIASWAHASVLAGPIDAELIETAQPGPPPQLTTVEQAMISTTAGDETLPDACSVSQVLHDGDRVGSAGEITVFHAPGHTDGSIALHWSDLGVLLTGDTIAEFHGDVILGAFHLDRADARASAERLVNLGADTVGFGHGDPILTGGHRRLKNMTDPLG